MSASADPSRLLQAGVHDPAAIWCYSPEAGLREALPPSDAAFRWLHLNLADQRSLRWLEREALLPPILLAFLHSVDPTERVVTAPEGIGLVLHDFGRGLETRGLGEIVPLQVVLVEGLVVTGRRAPVHSADRLRQRLEGELQLGELAAALDLLLGTLIDSFAALVFELNGHLLDLEADLMTKLRAPDARDLITARRRGAELHKLVGGLRALLQQMELHPGVPRHLADVPARLMPRLASLDTDIAGAQRQLRLIREELDLETTQRLNQNVYLLSVLTAIMAPATLVTGFFGMNTGGLPFAQSHHGTLAAFAVLLLSAGGTWWILRRLGLIRTR